jgi:hypothetical protein
MPWRKPSIQLVIKSNTNEVSKQPPFVFGAESSLKNQYKAPCQKSKGMMSG